MEKLQTHSETTAIITHCLSALKQSGTTCTNIKNLWILPKECVCELLLFL